VEQAAASGETLLQLENHLCRRGREGSIDHARIVLEGLSDLLGSLTIASAMVAATDSIDRSGTQRSALVLALFLALYGNAIGIVDWLAGSRLVGTAGGLLLGIGVVAGAWRGGRGSLIELGIRRTGLVRSLCGGLLLGLVMGLPSALYLWRPELAPIPVREEAIRALAPIAFLTLLFGQTLFATAIAEELAFRGLLQARLRTVFDARKAILIGALAFTGWHGVINARTLVGTGLASDPVIGTVACLGQALAVFIGGMAFGVLRERSGNLAGCIVAHWVVDALLLAGLYAA
jgi:membrane protease YdiL (CAAX protease family)